MKTEGWAIIGVHGLYTGWWLTRSEAIGHHSEALGKTWNQCRAKGDRAVKVCIRVKN